MSGINQLFGVEKAQTSQNSGASIRQGYDRDEAGNRKWVVHINSSEEHQFDSFEEAQTYATKKGYTLSKANPLDDFFSITKHPGGGHDQSSHGNRGSRGKGQRAKPLKTPAAGSRGKKGGKNRWKRSHPGDSLRGVKGGPKMTSEQKADYRDLTPTQRKKYKQMRSSGSGHTKAIRRLVWGDATRAIARGVARGVR